MDETVRRRFETQLIASGFSGLNDPELVPELAKLITNHDILRALLNECSRMERYAMLEAVRPHLPFKALTVEDYEAKTAEKFNAYESERQKIIAGDQEFERVAKELASHVVITLKCSICPKEANFAGESMVGAVILGRQDGWVRDRMTNKEVCPKHPSEYRSKRRKCPGCQRRHFAPDCRVIGRIEAIQPGGQAPLAGGAKENVVKLNGDPAPLEIPYVLRKIDRKVN